MNKKIKEAKFVPMKLEVGSTYLLNNGLEVQIIRKGNPNPCRNFPYYSTPFMPGTLVSAFSESGHNYVDPKVRVVSKVER